MKVGSSQLYFSINYFLVITELIYYGYTLRHYNIERIRLFTSNKLLHSPNIHIDIQLQSIHKWCDAEDRELHSE
jgi:hypothetical protein